jgi:hypothetical protein
MSPAPEQSVDTPLAKLDAICEEIFARWDRDQRSGKLLLALSGNLKRYRSDVDEVRSALAAAPELLAALKVARQWMPSLVIEKGSSAERDVSIVDAAIAKAEGRTPTEAEIRCADGRHLYEQVCLRSRNPPAVIRGSGRKGRRVMDTNARADAILATSRKVNMPHPDHEGKRVVGWVVDEDTAGLSDALFALEEIARRALAVVWRPIETAPKEHKARFLVFAEPRSGDEPTVFEACRYNDVHGNEVRIPSHYAGNKERDILNRLTGWMPLPAALALSAADCAGGE